MSSPTCEKHLATDHTHHASFEGSTNYIDPDGDLRLRVGSDTKDGMQDFVVCSRTIGRSSPVWKTMLFSGYKEAKPIEGEWIVSLPVEDSKALLTILNIIHGRFAEVPKNPSVEQLYRILALTHKYDMVKKVEPWATPWSDRLASLSEGQEKGGDAMLTFVARELGQEQIFRTLVNDLVMLSTTDSQGRLTTPDGHCLDDFDHFGPNDLAERICNIRRTTIQCLLNVVGEFTTSLSTGLRCTWYKPLPLHGTDRFACDSLILGSFWKSTIKERGTLFPSSATDVQSSIRKLTSEIFNSLSGIVYEERHQECSPAQSLQKLVVDTIQCRQSGVTSSHLKYMKKRRSELRLPDPKSA